jgi:hypothetical protein
MRREYDIFEKFPDGSTQWRACVPGKFETQRKIQSLAEHSENEFFAIDVQAAVMMAQISPRRVLRPMAKSAAAG